MRALGVGAAMLVASAAQADRGDRMQPLNFSADTARVDQVRQVNVLEGRVDVTKGTMVLRAARVEIKQYPDGFQTAVATGGEGGRSYFRQHREGADGEELIEGESDRIEYDGRANLIRFIGHAVMRRLQGSRVIDEVNGSTVVYDNTAQTFQVLSGASSAVPSGRVRGVLTPTVHDDDEPAAGSASAAPGSPAPAASGVAP